LWLRLEWRNAFIFEQIAKTSFVYQLLRISGEHICRFIYI